jgi:tetrahydromethanopterin S-methyltransferase subunit F
MRMIRPSWACEEDDITITSHRNQFAPRTSGLPVDYYKTTRAERIGGLVVTVVMSLAAVVIVLGLAFGWLA